MDTRESYKMYVEKMQRIADIRAANTVLQWDQETYLPTQGAHFRGQQMSTLSELAHQFFSDESLGNLINELLQKDDLTPEEKRNVQLTAEDYQKNKKYSSAFVRTLSDQTNKTFHTWIEARKQNDFSIFEKDLATLITLKKQETDILGYTQHPYDALLNEFEKGATVSLLDKTFTELLPPLKALLEKISTAQQVDNSFLRQHFPKKDQWAWGLQLIKALHFDSACGRQDVSEHPFSTSFSPQDVRITTRIDEEDFGNMTWSCIHETGHALYEQGLPINQYGLPLGEACSYSIHESQSRLWENNVGRSKPFWDHYYPQLKNYFPEQLKNISAASFYKGINKVKASFVRTEADEISYHFHVYIRYQVEKQLLEGNLQAHDIPAFWNSEYKKYLGVTVPDDKQGCLQDVHWSHGSFGYFPTYSLGSFYAAQFFTAASKEINQLEEKTSRGDTKELLQWLRSKIHKKGKYYTSEELSTLVSGEGLNGKYFMDYAQKKYGDIYGLAL